MPSKEQIEKFKRLPPAEQKALAMSLGINFDDYAFMLEGGGSSPSSVIPTEKVTGDRIQQQKKIQLEKQLKDLEKGISLEEDESPETTDEDIELFGYNVFDLGGEAFAPATDIPIPSDYVLGPGDTLVIQLFGKKNQTETLSITREGNILLPDIGPITLAGLTFSQVSKKVEEIVSKQMIGVTSSVTMSELRTIRVFVLGEVQIPGSYVIGSLSTMSNAIFSSGGITKIGSLRNIQLKRSGKIVTTLDLYDLLLRGDTSDDSRLLPGDVIFVPPIGKTVGLSGDVKRPAIYELKSEKSVEDALKLAGGLLPTAYMPASRIERITQAGEKTLVNLDLSTPQGKSFKLKDADVIQIFSTLNTMRDIVKLDGHVKRPGGFAWRQNMRFTDIVSDVDELLANPDIEIGLIKREQKLTRKITTVIFSPKKAFRNPSSAENPLLHPRDSVILFNYEDDRTELLKELVSQMKLQASFEEREKTVRVDGSVRFQGEYPLADNMKAQDLIHLAGGLLEHALETRAEITRRTLDENRNNSVMHLKIDPFQENPQLVEGDSLRILKVPMWKEKETITLQGEVMHPGTYSILPGETLMDVIHRSGGLTPHAYASGAVFSRVELRELEEERLQDLKAKIESDIAATNLTESSLKPGKVDDKEAQKIIENLSKVRPLGRMVIDLPKILSEPNSFDFPLEDGDSLTIPKHKPSIMVVGEVQYPTSHFFDRKLNTMDYVERSGGTKQNADKKRIYIVKANGRVFLPKSSAWFKVKGNNLEPGDTIVVPVDTDRVDPITMWSSVTTIMYQAALGVAAIASL
ncbi:SLBB domain-containing protein [Teredinibacter sp. KSP-S5-2]|uniref:SLBB domain-containing protein n=1 Tax=Teredinibacter sp. KSP-S5-2 TaxID=3034506 RepID=UPI00293436C6|nr:SLBB domain-containing protein [Teredinibacter sp. KSP-S5-2]WNO07843.1 SLBB domain-containing protein [Teredinibacter sp. KSP-S5-2]